jgi:glycerophosphoryl diester phosphodiesterase
MNHFAVVSQTYWDAWSRRRIFVLIQIVLQVAAWAAIAPALAGLIALAVSLSDQSALTDQDIAMFLLTPGGFVAAVGVLSVLLVAAIWGFAMMAAVFRAGPMDPWNSVRLALFAVTRRARFLLVFAGLFVLRVLVIVLPFVVAGLLVANRYMTEFDINYYLTFHPPEFLFAVGVIGVIVLAMGLVLLRTLTGWALALHLVVFGGVRPVDAFRESVAQMQGRRMRLALELVAWLAIRVALAVGVGVLAGLVLKLVPLTPGSGLKLALVVSLVVVALWALAGLVLNAVALGALARLLDGFYEDVTPLAPLPAGVAASLKRRVMAAGAVGVVMATGAGWAAVQFLDQLQTKDQVEIIAHRGAAGSRPENTMVSFAKAIEDRADWIELDVQETRNGDIVVVHDSDFMKLAGVDLKVWDSDLDALALIDIGSWYAPEYGDQRTPLLREVLEMAKGRTKVLIELKYYGHDQMLEQRVAQIVEDLGMENQIATMSLNYPAVQKMLELRPEWRTGVLAATAVGNLAGLEGDFIAVSTNAIGPRLIDKVHQAGKEIYVWTVNDPLQMSQMISMGADGLITDEPALVHQVLKVRAGLSTPERLVLWMSEELGLKLNTKAYRDDQP